MRNLTRIAGILIFLLIAGCTSTNFPTDGSIDSWNQFGYVEAKKDTQKRIRTTYSFLSKHFLTLTLKAMKKGELSSVSKMPTNLGLWANLILVSVMS